MPSFLEPPLKPRNGCMLLILAICRISTIHQDKLSLADQEALYRAWIEDHTDLPYELTVITGQGSGERLDRPEYLRAIDLVETSKFDLVISEDLARICRRVHAFIFCELCEDHDTRLIAINDHVDTSRDDWRLGSFFAVMRHEAYNKDTALRIRRTLRNRFMQGGVFQVPIYGYIKPELAKSEADVSKDPAAESVYTEWFRLLEYGASYSEVGDFLNERGIPTGPYCRSDKWDGRMVARVTHNPILKGVRERNNKISRPLNKTRSPRSVKAPPEELLQRKCPHLAFFDAAYYDRVVRVADENNSIFRRKGSNGVDPRRGVSRKRTVWPGQHIYCGICADSGKQSGRLFVYGGHGQKDHLMCTGAREYHCWNAITVDGPLAAQKMIAAIRAEIAALPDFDPILLQTYREEASRSEAANDTKRESTARDLVKVRKELDHIRAAIREAGHSRSLLEDLKRLEVREDQLVGVEADLDKASVPSVELPSIERIKEAAFEAFEEVAAESPEFGRLMKRLIPQIWVRPSNSATGVTLSYAPSSR